MNNPQIKMAARELCKLNGLSPDDVITHSDGYLLNPPVKRWVIAEAEIKKYLKIQKAIEIVQRRGVFIV